MIDIDRAVKIDGWMSDSELRWLGLQAQSHSRIVEIGSYLGRSTRILGENTPGFVLAVDDWFGPREVDLSFQKRQALFEQFQANMADLIQSGHVRYQRIDHALIQPDFIPDMVFIDGGHEYEDVVRDIKVWRALIAPGGLLCGHDAQAWGVGNAVIDLTNTLDVIPETDIWIWQKSKESAYSAMQAVDLFRGSTA